MKEWVNGDAFAASWLRVYIGRKNPCRGNYKETPRIDPMPKIQQSWLSYIMYTNTRILTRHGSLTTPDRLIIMIKTCLDRMIMIDLPIFPTDNVYLPRYGSISMKVRLEATRSRS
jgi:hypothetical protein